LDNFINGELHPVCCGTKKKWDIRCKEQGVIKFIKEGDKNKLIIYSEDYMIKDPTTTKKLIQLCEQFKDYEIEMA